MSRPLKGYKKCSDGVWTAAVPRCRGANQRVWATFDSEEAADSWLEAQIARLNQGLEAQDATKKPRRKRADAKGVPAAPPARIGSGNRDLRHYAHEWHDQHYHQLHKGGPERARDVLSDLDKHILPALGGLLDMPIEEARQAVVVWTRKMAGYPAKPGDPIDESASTYSRENVSGMLWALEQILTYAHALGAPVVMVPVEKGFKPAITYGISAMAPRKRVKRKARLVTFGEAQALAAEMNVIHQTVLWLLRVAGLRISEAYGLLVSNFIFDGEWGYLLVEAKGGRLMLERNDDEETVVTHRSESLKTAAGYRLLALPHALTVLICQVIEIFGTNPEKGEIDGTKRLIPTIRSEEGGIGGFSNALKKASRAVGRSLDEESLVIPHDMRKGFATDLAWSPDLESLVRRRAMGHRAGNDVFDLIYTLDDRLSEAMKPAALVIDAEIARMIRTLMVPTTKRPSYGTSLELSERMARDAALAEIGWQVNALGDDWIEADEAANILSMSVTATRRLFPDQLSAVKSNGQWWVRLDDVIVYRDRFIDWWRIEDLADKVGATYHQVHSAVQRLGLSTTKDEYSRQLLLTTEQADEVIGEFARIEALRQRAVPASEVARVLNASLSSIHLWVKIGRLEVDAESDASGKVFVTRASIQNELDRRGLQKIGNISAAELKEWSGLDDKQTRALVAAGLLKRGSDGGYTTESVENWATGYRPDLLTSGLIRYEQPRKARMTSGTKG